jgi:hypothetical protein
MPYLHSTTIPDDAYYYFTIARNIVDGFGVTFDGIEPTNGFHPLWMISLLPVFTMSTADTGIRAALTLSSLFSLVTALEVKWIVERWSGSRRAAILSGGLFLFQPHAIAAALNGLETSLALMLLGGLIIARERLRDRVNSSSVIMFGLSLGLLWLGRTDYIFVSGLALVDFAWQVWRGSRRLRWLVLTAVVAALTVSPWLTWNIKSFGTPFQVSGNAYPTYQRIIAARQGDSDSLTWLARHEASAALQMGLWVSSYSGMDKLVLIVAPIVAWLTWISARQKGSATRRLLWTSIVSGWYILVGIALQLAAHFLYRWMWVPWYMAPTVAISTVYFGMALVGAWTGHRRLAGVLAAMLLLGYSLQWYEVYVQQATMLRPQASTFPSTLASANEMCQSMSHLGITDSGYVGFYANCRITNLDGVVNNAAYHALVDGTFVEYLQARGIQAVLLNEHVRAVLGEDLTRLDPMNRGWLRVPAAENCPGTC